MQLTNIARKLSGFSLAPICCVAVALAPEPATAAMAQPMPASVPAPETCGRIVKADVVAIEQAYILNRLSAFVPAGMMFALRRDVVGEDGSGNLVPGKVRLRPDKRPRPLVLRVNEGDCLEVRLTNLLSPTADEEGGLPPEDGGRLPGHVTALAGSSGGEGLVRAQKTSVDRPRTRAASLHVTGLELVPIPDADCPLGAACGGDGSNVGLPQQQGLGFNPATPPQARARFDIGSLAHPGQTVVTRWRAEREGAYFAYSTAAPVGGEGDGGQIGLGLFAAVNVEPKGSRWYRSQVTYEEMQAAKNTPRPGRHPYAAIDYEREASVSGHRQPILDLLDRDGNIVHSDLNAIVVPERAGQGGPESQACTGAAFGSTCDLPFREFTVIFHDEIHAEQAFAELDDENGPLHAIKDGMGINYGSSGMGSLVMTTPTVGKNTGVAKNCPECRAEEFFLSSWANGDPALILAYRNDKPVGARYPDDPSNVHHSYLGDPVRFRNLHAGPKETHVFHLHAHQWMQDQSDPNSTYLDSQTISPGATFSYSIGFGGTGNRNYTPGDSIFHCHLYPHFAQGMWELWRVHDAFVDGRPGFFHADRPVGPNNDPGMLNLPDPEIADGTASPALVPIPASALAPMPTREFRGYPFYIPGKPGHRPPQPVLDLDVDGHWANLATEPDEARIIDGGLPRHVVSGGTLATNVEDALKTGGDAAQVIAQRVAKQNPEAVATLAREWNTLSLDRIDLSGTPEEKTAMAFHEGTLQTPGFDPVAAAAPHPAWWKPKAYRTDVAAPVAGQMPPTGPPLFFVNGRPRAQGAPYANPCPENAPMRDYRTAFIQTELTYNKHGWFDPQGRIVILENDIKDVIDPDTRTKLPEPLFFRANSGECISFRSSNFVPAALNADDFQIYTPTDTIGEHIHLVKFDVTSSDGSGNGFNYEDATFSPQEVRERIFAYNRTPNADGSAKTAAQKLWPKEHPLFREGGDIWRAAKADPARYGALLDKGRCPPKAPDQSDDAYAADLEEHHPLCGAQRTNQRWWADPILNTVSGKDNTLRTVFTHDHLGPSSHQQHGLYAGLVIEPANSVWTRIDKTVTAADLATARSLQCGPGATNDPAGLCDKLLGGSNLALPTDAAILDGDPLEKPVAPRPPLRLREDGGPTATMANILAPKCIGDSDSNPMQPPNEGRNRKDAPKTPSAAPRAQCPPERQTHDTRREFDLAIADFGIAYNTALEPINPEPRGEDSILRDRTFLRFGRRHVASAPARPLAISSEDPGSQYFNYRHEPLALRLSEATPDPVLGGWNYRQNPWRSDLATPCRTGDQDCLGDPANGFSTAVHAKRDEKLAKDDLPAIVTPQTRALLAGTPAAAKLDGVLEAVERWRKRFNCALYPTSLMGPAEGCPDTLARLEPWRVFGDPATPILPAFEGDPVQIRLIQGAQEAQHIFTMNGNKWHRFPGSNGARNDNDSGFVNAQPVGISEHFEFDVIVNPFEASHADYLYFGSSMDQLWDGLWGTMRAFSRPEADQPGTRGVTTSASPAVSFRPGEFLATLPDVETPPRRGGNKPDICSNPAAGEPEPPHRYFDVSAVRICDLFGDCGTGGSSAIEYSTRFGIRDEKGLAYVLEAEGKCESADACDQHESDWTKISNRQSLARLRSEFSLGRRLQPLVLRAAAGECLHVNLRNQLPASLDDGPRSGPDGKPVEVAEARAYHNLLPMITDGFNINQFRMSSSVGLSPARLAQHPIFGDGSNVGLNSAVLTAPQDEARPPAGAPPDQVRRQGTLVPPCLGPPAVDGTSEDRCRNSFVWSATDFQFDEGHASRPVEFGAVPLRDFGDVLKHAAHGLVGALVVGPEGSGVCPNDRFAARLPSPDGPRAVPGGISAEICRRDGSRYVDHVLVLQDGVNATRGGLPVGNLSGAEEPDDYGVKALNYKTEPLWARTGGDPSIGFSERGESDQSAMLSSATVWKNGVLACASGVPPVPALANPCDPETPVLAARPGEEVRLDIVHPGGHTRQQGLAISGHAWNPYPWSQGSRVLDPAKGSSIRQGVFNGFGPMMGVSLVLKAGGSQASGLDYLIRSQASFLFDGGIWGILRVAADPRSLAASPPARHP